MTDTPERVHLHPPADVVWIARRLEEAGHVAWAVGGAVRDELAGLTAGDWDLTTSARPAEVRRIFRRTVPLGIEHGTVGVVARGGTMYEVTTFRRDVETFGRKARVAFSETLEEDLERRDFTMNAIAWHPLTWELRDPHGGRADLARGVLRTVGDPERRFAEDRLRVLRALRFAGRYGLEIESATWEAARSSSDLLAPLSAERIREELRKVLTAQRWPSRTLRLYAESGVLRSLYPELERLREDGEAARRGLWEETLRTVDRVSPRAAIVRLAALFHRVGFRPGVVETNGEAGRSAAIAREVLRRLRSSNAEVDQTTHLIAQLESVPTKTATNAELRRWIRRVGAAHVEAILRLLFAMAGSGVDGPSRSDLTVLLRRTRTAMRDAPALAIGDLAIDGDDLRTLGLPPGPLYGEILRELLEQVTDEPELNQRDTLLDLVRSRIDAVER